MCTQQPHTAIDRSFDRSCNRRRAAARTATDFSKGDDMATQSARGVKRTCQNEECGARFYDLMHDPIACPICQTVFVPVAASETKPKATWKTSRHVPRHTIVAPEPVEEEEDDETAAVEAIETTEEDDAEAAPEKQDMLLDLDEDDDASGSGVVVSDTKD